MLDKLEMFIAVAREEHFGRAAASLNLTQPTLSAGIRQLEDQLGVKLIFRGSRYGGLTPEGQSALIWARRIVADARQLRDEMQFSHRGLSGQVRIAAIPTALTWASRLSARMGEKHPNVRITIQSRTSAEILSMMEDLEADAGISYLDNEPLGRLTTQPLYEERYMLVCSERSPFARRRSVAWRELNALRLCLLTPDMQNRRIINSNFAAAGVEPDARIELNSIVVLVASVESGDWATILPEDLARFLTKGKAMKVIPISGSEPGYAVGLLAPYREPHTPVLRALLGEARRMAAD